MNDLIHRTNVSLRLAQSPGRDQDGLVYLSQVDVIALLALVDELTQTLLKYGRHKPECQMYGLHHCTCGWYGEYLKRDEIIRTLATPADGEVDANR